jgi:hypothetical protein
MKQTRDLAILIVLCSLTAGSVPALAIDEKLKRILEAPASGIPWLSLATEDKSVRAPEPGSGDASVGPGDSMYAERHQTLVSLMSNTAVLKQEFNLPGRKGVRLPPDTSLANFFLTNPNQPTVYMRCSQAHTSIKQSLLSGPIFNSAICFRENAGFLVPHFFKKYVIPPGVRLKYELIPQVLESALRGDGSKEILYQGVGAGVLRLTYREYTGEDMARPAFTQEVTYDMAKDGPTEVLFKGAHITILSAGNTEVRYRVATPFKQ